MKQGAKHVFFIEARYSGAAKQLIIDSPSPKLPNGVQRIIIKTKSILFAKEVLLNAALDILPSHVTKILALDADILFEEDAWYDTISKDLDKCDVLQPFFSAKLKNESGKIGLTKKGWAKAFLEDAESEEVKSFQAHAGYGIAFTKNYLNSYNGFFKGAIGGSGDEIHIRIAAGVSTQQQKFDYLRNELDEYESRRKSENIFGFSELSVIHLFHGDEKNRQYVSRHAYFIEQGFSLKECQMDGIVEFKTNEEKWNAMFFTYFKNRNDDNVQNYKKVTMEEFFDAAKKQFTQIQKVTKVDQQAQEELHNQDVNLDELRKRNKNCDNSDSNRKRQEQGQNFLPSQQNSCWRACTFALCWYGTSRQITHNDVLVDVRTGLFNRLRVLVAVIWANENDGRKWNLWCHWPINEECSVDLEEFYSISSSQIQKIKHYDDALFVAQRIPQERIFGDFNSSCRAPGPLTVLKSLKTKVPTNFGDLFTSLKFKPLIYTMVKIQEKMFPPKPWTGLHIRRSDAVAMALKLGKDMPSMELYIEFAKKHSNHVILATDDTDVVQLMKYRLGEHRISVVSDPSSQKIIKTNYGTRPDAGLSILSNAIILSKCSEFMGTPTSSITEVIELWRKKSKFTLV